MSSKASTITEYEISKETLFKSHLADGSHKHTLEDGIIVEAHVKGGSITGYTAYDASGKVLPVTRMRLSKTSTADAHECIYCICGEFTCRCWKEPCVQ